MKKSDKDAVAETLRVAANVLSGTSNDSLSDIVAAFFQQVADLVGKDLGAKTVKLIVKDPVLETYQMRFATGKLKTSMGEMFDYDVTVTLAPKRHFECLKHVGNDSSVGFETKRQGGTGWSGNANARQLATAISLKLSMGDGSDLYG